MRIFALALLLISIVLGIVSLLSLKTHSSLPKGEKRYARIVTLAPSMSETMVALNQAHLVVGASSHCHAREIAHAQKVGSFAEPNFEAILALSPDLVLAVPHVMAKKTLDELEANGIEVFAHQPDSLNDIKYIISALAKKLGIEEKGLELNQEIDQAILQAKNAISQFGDRKSTLIAVSPAPFVVAGKSTFASEIIEALGLTNMADDKRISWPIWPLENLLSNPPKILILADGRENMQRYHKLFDSLGFDYVKAKIRLIVPEKPVFTIPSPSVIKDIVYLIRLLQPFYESNRSGKGVVVA